MSFTSIPNQPILFGSTDSGQCVDCGGGEYKQLVDLDDQLFFQVEAPVCGDKLAISNQNVQVWTEEARSICGDADALGVYSFNFTALHPVSVFKFSIIITSMTAGELTVSIEGGNSQTLYTAGTFDFYLQSDLVINGDFSPMVTVTGASFIGCFNSGIDVYEVATDVKVGWVNANTLELESAADYITTIVDNVITVALDMTTNEIGEGCHRLALSGSCDTSCGASGIVNGSFLSSAGWDLTAGVWTISGGEARFTVTGVESKTIYNTIELCEGLSYKVIVDVTTNTDIRLFASAGTGGTSSPSYIATSGINTFNIVAGTGDLRFALRAQAILSGGGSIVVNSVSVELAAESIEWNTYSDVLSVGDYDTACETMTIGGCNASDQFGFKFGGSSFLPSIRIEGKRFRPQYDFDVDAFRSASGKWTANYVDRLKKYTFHFRVNEQVLDFLSLVFYFDNCYINGQKYFPANDEFPQIQWDDADDKFGRLDIEMYLKQEKVTKVLCSASDADCLPSILDNDTENFLLTEGGERITTEGSVNILW